MVNEQLEQANALGFTSVEEMKNHQQWLEKGKERQQHAKIQIQQAKDAGSPIIDMTKGK